MQNAFHFRVKFNIRWYCTILGAIDIASSIIGLHPMLFLSRPFGAYRLFNLAAKILMSIEIVFTGIGSNPRAVPDAVLNRHFGA